METWEKITGGAITFALSLAGWLGKRNLDQIDKKVDETKECMNQLAETTHQQGENIAGLTTAVGMQHDSIKMLMQKAIDE